MRRVFFVVALIITGAVIDAQVRDAAGRAHDLIMQARAALGGDEKLNEVHSLSATGNFRRSASGGGLDTSGQIELELLQPDKIIKTETQNLFGAEITRIDAVNGDNTWSDVQTSDGGGGAVFVRRDKATPEQEAEGRKRSRADLIRCTFGLLLATPQSFPVELSYVGAAEAEDGKADVIDVKGPDGFNNRLFLDQKSHLPLMISYMGIPPRVVFSQKTFGGTRPNPAELEKSLKEADAQVAKPVEVEMQVRFSDYKKVNGLMLPHAISKAVNGETNEEWTMTKFQINPALKAEKFEKK